MKKSLLIFFFAGIAVLAAPGIASAQKKPARVIVGTISEYECGDNCYLTIIDVKGKKHHALCAAALCRPWNENAEMPSRFKGRKVRATLGRGNRYDGSGDLVDRYPAFTTIRFVTR